jgi:undecaprenyl diphosphate synthase
VAQPNTREPGTPRHVAVIMDGNGRWAKERGLPRTEGHRRGADSVETIVEACGEMGVEFLTLYAFSMENWLRPKAEVRALLTLLKDYLVDEVQEMMDQDIRLTAIGNLDSLGDPVLTKLRETIERTAGNKGMVLNLALSYGGRDEIATAASRMVSDTLAGKIKPADVTKELCQRYLYTSTLPDPDLLIRTGGEYRISNFLLWQMAYTEFYFTDLLWPDFREPDLMEAIAEYQQRERRFGRTSGQIRRT